MYLLNFIIFSSVIVQISLSHRFEENKNANQRNPLTEYLQLDPTLQHELVEVNVPEQREGTSKGTTLSAGKRIHIRAFGEDVNLWLHPKDSILVTQDTPVYVARYSSFLPGNADVVQWPGVMKLLGQVYEDPNYLASFVIGTDNSGRMMVNGRIEALNLVIRSVPGHVVRRYVEQRRSSNDSIDEFVDPRYHVVYRTSGKLEREYPLNGLRGSPIQMRTRETSSAPSVIYPKILIVVDYSIYKSYSNSITGLLEYIITFANGVDLKYRSLEAPRFRFHIAGILLAIEPNGLPYISSVMLNDNAFNSTTAMVDARKYFYHTRDFIPLAKYDIALTLTRHMFGLPKGEANVLGKAWVGVTCGKTMQNKALEAVAICRDDGSFSSIHIAAHELGHIFGLWHDGTQSDDCAFNNGFIMAFTPWYTKNSSSFSNCSLNDFQQKIDERKYECMYQRPDDHEDKLPNLMPGRVKNLEEQCKSMRRGEPCNITSVDICVNIHCQHWNGKCVESGVAALEGTLCSDPNEKPSRYCVANRCVPV